jgi:hypothetical protein
VGLLQYRVPILDGTQRLGVLGAEAARGAEETLRYLAAMVALQLVSKSPFSDAHARLVRTRPMNVAAEMQWGLIPPRSIANEAADAGVRGSAQRPPMTATPVPAGTPTA